MKMQKVNKNVISCKDMTVKDLIEVLVQYESDAKVEIFDHYEGSLSTEILLSNFHGNPKRLVIS